MIHAELIATSGEKMKQQQMNVSSLNSQQVSETQRLMEDPRVQRAMDKIVRLSDDLRDVSSVILSTWEEQHKNSETDPKTNQEDAVDPESENDNKEMDKENKEEDKKENKEGDKKENKEGDKKEDEKQLNELEKEQEKNEDEKQKENTEKEEEKNEEREEKDADNKTVDDDISSVVHSSTKSILNQPTQKTIESDVEKQLQAETNIELKNIHQEIVSKVKINLDCGEKDVQIDFVSKTMKGNKSRMHEMLELYQVVDDYCFVKYSPFKHEEIGKFENLLMITRDDTTSLAPTTPVQMIKSNIVQCWSFTMNDSRLKEDPSCFFFGIDHNRPLELSLRSQDASQQTDKAQVEEMSYFLKRINHEKADEILEYEFDEVNFKWKTPRYTLDCGVFAMIHMLCFSGDTFDSDLDLANRRKVYRAEICAALALADINTKRKQIMGKISRFRVVRKLEKEKGVEDMIYVSNFLKKHKEVMDNMSLTCHQVIDYLAINDDENFPNKSEVVGWFIDSIEIVRQDCNALLNEWKVSSNMSTAWSNHLNNIEMQKDRSENNLVRFFFGFEFMDALTMCLNAHGKKGVTSLQKLWIDLNNSQSLDMDAA
uniref:Ubiquitin-like protease family profile domain-containing protein n=1 Tax=Chenopodium quinoa TaxID=63459 RepID=A0A803MYR7_CHEQI